MDTRNGGSDCLDMVARCQSGGLLEAEDYRRNGRPAQRWALTEKGHDAIKWDAVVKDEIANG